MGELQRERDELAARVAEVTAERDELLHWRGITERLDAVTAQALDMMNRALADTTRERDETRAQLADALRLGLDECERLRTAVRISRELSAMSPDVLRITRHSIAQLTTQRDAARAEVTRLRAALQKIVRDASHDALGPGCGCDDYCRGWDSGFTAGACAAADDARAALGDEREGG
jgi:AcrR family transcriptional regulator